MRRAVYAIIAIAILALVGGFPAYMAFGQGGSNIAGVTVTATPSFVTGPGGGGGGGGAAEEGCPVGEVSAVDKTTIQGLVIKAIVVESFDGRLRLIIDEGTLALTYAGLRLGCIGIHEMTGSPSPPEDAYLIGVMYDVVPDGATFSPPATIRYSYELNDIPEGVAEERLVIASYDEISGEWVKLYSIVDIEANTITAKISRFNDLAVFGYGVEAPPPAAFQVSSLRISPNEVYTGEAVNITLRVTNSGGQSASYQVILKINGVAEAAKEVVLDAGASEQVSFTTSKGVAGTYSLDINGVTGSFEVKEKLVPKPFNWWITAVIIAALALAASLVYVFREKIEASGITGTLSIGTGKVTSLAPKVMAAIRSLLSKLNKLIKKK